MYHINKYKISKVLFDDFLILCNKTFLFVMAKKISLLSQYFFNNTCIVSTNVVYHM